MFTNVTPPSILYCKVPVPPDALIDIEPLLSPLHNGCDKRLVKDIIAGSTKLIEDVTWHKLAS